MQSAVRSRSPNLRPTISARRNPAQYASTSMVYNVSGRRRRVWRRIAARRFQKPTYFFACVNVGPAAASDHFLQQHPVAFWRHHCQPATIQFFGDHSADLNALHSDGRGRGARNVFPDQLVQRLLVCTCAAVVGNGRNGGNDFRAGIGSQASHPVHMIANDRAHVTAIAWRRTK